MKRVMVLVVLLVAGLAAPGCIAVGGSTTANTVGQELLDLKVALEQGAITEVEYEQQKARLLSK